MKDSFKICKVGVLFAMLIEFSVENYKCFATQQTLNMRPDPEIHSLDENLIRTGLTQENGEELILLPTVAIYGANASGKSNLINAIYLMERLVLKKHFPSTKQKEIKVITEPTTFFNNKNEVLFDINQVFQDRTDSVFNVAYAKTALKLGKQSSDTRLIGNVQSLKISDKDNPLIKNKKSQLLYGFNQRSNRILSGWMPNVNIESLATETVLPTLFREYFHLNDIIEYSEAHIDQKRGIFDVSEGSYFPLIETLKDETKRKKLETLVKKADFNIEYIHLERLKTGREMYSVEFKIKGQDEILYFDAQSEGTKRFLLMMPTIVHVLETGAILLADELEQHLHPDLCKEVLKLFNNPETNPHGSQLILTTHNQDLMSSKLMRPDQIYFINKDDKTGASTLCRASDFKKIDWNNRKYKVDALYNDGVFDAKPHTYGLE